MGNKPVEAEAEAEAKAKLAEKFAKGDEVADKKDDSKLHRRGSVRGEGSENHSD